MPENNKTADATAEKTTMNNINNSCDYNTIDTEIMQTNPLIDKNILKFDNVSELKLKCNFEGIANELKNQSQWITWKLQTVDDKLTKVPYSVINGTFMQCDATNLNNAVEFDDATKMAKDHACDGLGFILNGDGVVILDVDHCINDDGTFNQIATELLNDVDLKTTYVEYSQSKKGLHFIFSDFNVVGIAGRRNSPLDIEIYANKHYFAITGYRLEGYGSDLADCQNKTKELIEKYFDGGNNNLDTNAQNELIKSRVFEPAYRDEQILEIISHCKNHTKFNDLFYNGSTTAYNGDDSAADAALMLILAFYTNGNPEQMERLFSKSKLAQREKWQRNDYRRMTIANTLKYWIDNGSAAFSPKINAQNFNETNKVNDIIQFLKMEKYKEAAKLARETIDSFLAKDEITLDDIYSSDVLYSVGYFIANATVSIEHQLITKKFRDKCKRITQLTGDSGLDKTVERYAAEIKAIGDERDRKIAERRQKEYLEKLRQKSELAIQKKCPLPIREIVMPNDYQIDIEKQCTVALKVNVMETVFNSISLITKRIKNIDTGIEKLEIATLKSTNKHWSYVTTERANIANTRKIVELSNAGVDVNSLNASEMVDFFNKFEVLNANIIRDVIEVNQAGWRNDDNFILPNSNENYIIDNTKNSFIDAIKQKGSFDVWLDLLKEVRQYPLARFITDAAIASPLLYILNERCFSIYVYGDSKAGKTAVMKFGGSEWGNPDEIAKSFNCTQNGIEVAAAMRSDFVMIMNEKQLAEESNKRNRLDLTKFLYLIGEGAGKTTMDRNRNERKSYKWRVICLANGETSIIDNATTQGAITRSLIFNLEDKLLPSELSRKLYQNMHLHYGHAGKCFIDNLLKEDFDVLRNHFNVITERLSKLFINHIEEHIRYTCVIALADFLIQKFFYHVDEDTAMSEALNLAVAIIQKLKTADELSDVQNEISFISNWIVENKNHFVGTSEHLEAKHLTVFGEEDEQCFYITVKAFKEACDSQSINYKKAIKDFVKAGYAIPSKDRNTVSHWLTGCTTKCVKILKSKLE